MAEFQFCPKCGGGLQVRNGRLVCEKCGFILYRNPTVGVAVILLHGDRILLGRRSRGRYEGAWCIPCGHVEWGEEVRTAARREFLEETGPADAPHNACRCVLPSGGAVEPDWPRTVDTLHPECRAALADMSRLPPYVPPSNTSLCR